MALIRNAWYLTNYSCNCKCRWCYAESEIKQICKEEKIIPLSEAKEKIDFLKMTGTENVILLGGESTLLPYFVALVEYIKDQGMIPSLITNGVLCANKEFLDDVFKAGLNHMTFSLEGHNGDMHDYATKHPGSFDCIKKAANICKKKNYEFSTLTTISALTAPFVKEIAVTSSKLEPMNTVFNLCSPSVSRDNYEHVLSPFEYARIIEDLGLFVIKNGIKSNMITAMPKCLFSRKNRKKLENAKFITSSRGCQVFGDKALVVDFNGEILPCAHWSGLSIANIKNIKDKTQFDEMWDKKEGLIFRESVWKYPSKECVDCKEWGKTCVGGCILFWLKFRPEDEIRYRNDLHEH